MSEVSLKHQNFVTEPMSNKDVTEVAGIGGVIGESLKMKGYLKASTLLGQFLILNKDEETFKLWLEIEAKAGPKQQRDCYNCLVDWCNQFL